MNIRQLSQLATGRESNLFAEDVTSVREQLRERLFGRRILAIGAAGSIGSATLRSCLSFQPAALHVVDQDENGLTELVRDLRSSDEIPAVTEFRALPLDFGGMLMRRFLAEGPGHDIVLNFAALKHVRSEKDVYSMLRMLDTNVVKQAALLTWLAEIGVCSNYFCVSTDKAANPVNVMGASKRVMEHVMFQSARTQAYARCVTSARFANVAFSAGSLLEGFLYRFREKQPIAVPTGVSRYFVSLEEAGDICMLAALMGPPQSIVIPSLSSSHDLRQLQEIAESFVRTAGYEPRLYSDERSARAAVKADLAGGGYPILLTSLDTEGEKPYEEFVGSDEEVCDFGLARLKAVPYVNNAKSDLSELMGCLENAVATVTTPTKNTVLSWLARFLPNFQHVDAEKQLDQRM